VRRFAWKSLVPSFATNLLRCIFAIAPIRSAVVKPESASNQALIAAAEKLATSSLATSGATVNGAAQHNPGVSLILNEMKLPGRTLEIENATFKAVTDTG